MPALTDMADLLGQVRRKQMAAAEHGARLILAAIAATGRQPLTKRQQEELPGLRKLAGKYEGRAIPIAVALTRLQTARRVMPQLVFKGFARWELGEDGLPALVVKELGEP